MAGVECVWAEYKEATGQPLAGERTALANQLGPPIVLQKICFDFALGVCLAPS